MVSFHSKILAVPLLQHQQLVEEVKFGIKQMMMVSRCKDHIPSISPRILLLSRSKFIVITDVHSLVGYHAADQHRPLVNLICQ